MRGYIGISVAVVLFCVVGVWFMLSLVAKESKEIAAEAPVSLAPPPIVFVSPNHEESVQVTFGTSTALLSGKGYSNILFTASETASGTVYEHTAKNLSLWSDGATMRLVRGRKVLFVGQNKELVPEPVEDVAGALATTTPIEGVSASSGSTSREQ